MKVSGFTFIRNAIKFDYPVVEAIQSILPLCDEVIVAVGEGEDNTRELIAGISPKIKIIDTVWNDDLREGGRVLAEETNKALAAISPDSDWAFYIQGDEVMHEKYIPAVAEAMQKYKDNEKVDGLLFNYLHFYGSYKYYGSSTRWYRREIRIIKPKRQIYSFRDAQGFRKANNQKLNVKLIDAYIYHYGWVKEPQAQQRKAESFHRYWHDDRWMEKHIVKADAFDYKNIDSLDEFKGTHPEVMLSRISKKDWDFEFDTSKKNLPLKHKIKLAVEKYTGWRIGEYRNYRLV